MGILANLRYPVQGSRSEIPGYPGFPGFQTSKRQNNLLEKTMSHSLHFWAEIFKLGSIGSVGIPLLSKCPNPRVRLFF